MKKIVLPSIIVIACAFSIAFPLSSQYQDNTDDLIPVNPDRWSVETEVLNKEITTGEYYPITNNPNTDYTFFHDGKELPKFYEMTHEDRVIALVETCREFIVNEFQECEVSPYLQEHLTCYGYYEFEHFNYCASIWTPNEYNEQECRFFYDIMVEERSKVNVLQTPRTDPNWIPDYERFELRACDI